MDQVDLPEIQRELFSILEEFFQRATGTTVLKFAEVDEFPAAVRKNAYQMAACAADQIAAGRPQPYQWVTETLRNFYAKYHSRIYKDIKSLGGAKLVLGGSSRFTPSHLAATRKMLLYADTVLIPDPVLPWIETERSEEAFRLPQLLQQTFMLLHLKPLVDAHLPYPAIVVFPSWEKSLEEQDEETQAGLQAIATDFFSFYLDKPFGTFQEVASYARNHESDFLNTVDTNHLFIAAGGELGESLTDGLKRFKAEDATWMASSFQERRSKMSDSLYVLEGIVRRLTPQYHLLENASELVAQPMLAVEQPWHYYSLCAKMYSGKLEQNNLLEPSTVSTLRALQHSNLHWLGNVPIDALAELRKNNENETFRRQLEGYTKILHEADLDNINRVAAEVGHGLSALLVSHQKEIQAIESKYNLLYAQSAVGGWVTLAAMLSPALAPFVASLSVSALAIKYGTDKLSEVSERKKAAKSLMGVLASTRQKSSLP